MNENDLLQSDEFKKAKTYALARVGRKECSSHDIKQTLLQKGISAHVADLIVEEFTKRSWVSDERYTQLLIRQQANRGKGPRLIQQKLKEQGITLSCNQVSEISSDVCENSEVDTARIFVERKYPQFREDRKTAARATQALLRRGFSFDVIQKVMRPTK